MTEKRRFAALLLTVLLLLAGCRQGETSAPPSPSAVPNEGEDYGVVTIENGERTITFTQMPQKVLCCHLYAAENMVMLGLEDYIVGKNVAANPAETPLPELADAFADIPEVERSLSGKRGKPCGSSCRSLSPGTQVPKRKDPQGGDHQGTSFQSTFLRE